MADTLTGKEITDIDVVDVTKVKGSWRYGSVTQSPGEFRTRLQGGRITAVQSVANSLFLTTTTGHILVLGYLSGSALYHEPGQALPKRSCFRAEFTDDSQLSVTISMWGLIRVLDAAEKLDFVARWYGPAVEPTSKQYTWAGFCAAAKGILDAKLSAKKFLHAFEPCYYVAGIDSGYAIEILHRAKIHPRRTLASLNLDELKACYSHVNAVMKEAICRGGRASEVDLFGHPGRFIPHVCKDTLGQPCHECGTPIEKFKFEGGSSYVCPKCQLFQEYR